MELDGAIVPLVILLVIFCCMNMRVTAPSLTPPTYETLKEYALRRFNKVDRLMKLKKGAQSDIRISVKKVGNLFKLTAELKGTYHVVVHTVDRDIRKVIDSAWDMMSRQIRNTKEKLIDHNRGYKDLSFSNPQFIT